MRHPRVTVIGSIGLGLCLCAMGLAACGGKGTGGETCEPDTVRCSGSRVERCLPTGTGWYVVEECAAQETCLEGLCLPNACDPGTRICADDAVVYVCAADGQSWTRSVCPEDTQCLLGQCIECVNNQGCPGGQICDQGRCVASAVEIVTEALPEGIVSVPYNTALQASQGIEPYTWSLTGGALPGGFDLDEVTGVISGTPTLAGDYDFTATVTDAASAMDSRALSLRVRGDGLEIITPSNLPIAEEGYDYEVQLQAAGGLVPYGWMITSGVLPAGLDLFAGGRIAGIPSEVGTFPFQVRVFDSLVPPQYATKDMNLVVNIAPLVIIGDTEYNFYVTKIIVLDMIFPILPYSEQLQAKGGLKPYLWEEKAVPTMLALMLQLAGVDPNGWGIPEGLTLAQDGKLTGSLTSLDGAQTITIPVANISVTGFFFYAGVSDSQFPPESQEAAFVIPTIPL